MSNGKEHSDDSLILKHSLIWNSGKSTQTATDIWRESKKDSSDKQKQKGK